MNIRGKLLFSLVKCNGELFGHFSVKNQMTTIFLSLVENVVILCQCHCVAPPLAACREGEASSPLPDRLPAWGCRGPHAAPSTV